jgi:hypothetical protein
MKDIGIAVIIDKAPESGGLSCRFKGPMGVAPRRSVMGNSYPSEETPHRGLGFNAGQQRRWASSGTLANPRRRLF